MQKTIKDRIHWLLKQKGMTVKSLAKEININYTTLLAALKKEKDELNSKFCVAIANYFDVSLDWLLTGNEDLSAGRQAMKKKVAKTKSLFRFKIRVDIDLQKKYNATLEEALEKKISEFNSWVNEEASKLQDEERDDFAEYVGDKYSILTEHIQNTLRLSLVVTSFSLLERELTLMCKNLKEESTYSLNLSDITGKGIERCKKYLKKVAGIDFPDNSLAWRNILVYKEIRNFIVHNNAKLDNSDKAKKIKDFMKNKNSVALEADKRMKFSKDFPNEVVNTLKDFFKDLLDALP